MKILILTRSVALSNGGVREAVKNLYLNFSDNQKSNIQIYALEYDNNKDLYINEFSPLLLSIYSKNIFFYSKLLHNNVLGNNSDILHLHGLFGYPHVLVNEWKIKYPNSKLIISPHGMLDEYAVSKRSKIKVLLGNLLFVDKSFKNASCFVALNKSEYCSIRKYGIKSPVAIINNGINLPIFNSSLRLNISPKRLLFLSRLHSKKGLDILIEAMREFVKISPLTNDWILDVVGSGDNGYEKKIKEKVLKYDLSKKIIFHGALWGEDKDVIFKQSHAFILPSYSEGQPLSILEAWSYSLPVIMTSECNLPEGFSTNSAIRIEPTKESILEGLVSLLKMPNDELIQMGLNGRFLVQSEFSWYSVAKQMEDLYNWLLGTGEKPSFIYL